MSIPLVQKAEKDDINTSIIAIKRNIERINMLLGLSNSEEIDTSKFATKEELQQTVTDLQPVDEVAVDNMHSVTSGAVYSALSNKANIQGSEFTSSMAGAIQYHTNFFAPDLNTLTASGFFSVNIVNASSSHAPITGGATLIVCRFNDANVALTQTITYLSNILYTRTCNGGTWSAWKKVLTDASAK